MTIRRAKMMRKFWGSPSRMTAIRAVLIIGVVLSVLSACSVEPGQTTTGFDDMLSITIQSPANSRGISAENYAVTSLVIEVTRVSTGAVVDTISWVPSDGTRTYDLPVPGAGAYEIAVAHHGTNSSGETVVADESVTVNIQPMLIAVVSITPGQIGLIRVDGPVPVAVGFPTSSATVCNASGYCRSLGGGGGGSYYRAGDYLQETLVGTGVSSITGLDLSFDMDDHTTTYCTVGLLEWDVSVNGTVVGTYSYTGGSQLGRISFNESYSFATIVGSGPNRDNYTIRLQATTTVCPGASSWNWFPGGTATLNP